MRSWFSLIFILPVFLVAAELPGKPDGYVTDKAGVLTAGETQLLNQKLYDFQKNTSNQVFIFIDSTLNGADLEQTCQAIFHHWGIGQKGKNNGVLIAVFIGDHKFRIHTGYGLEGALPDVLCKRIQADEMQSYFKSNNFYAGINAGVNKIIDYTKGEFKPDTKYEPGLGTAMLIGFGINAILFIVGLLYFKRTADCNSGTRKFIMVALVLALCLPFVGILVFITIFAAYYNFRLWRSSQPSSTDYTETWRTTTIYSPADTDAGSESNSYSSSDFDGGDGGDSGGGGSDSNW